MGFWDKVKSIGRKIDITNKNSDIRKVGRAIDISNPNIAAGQAFNAIASAVPGGEAAKLAVSTVAKSYAPYKAQVTGALDTLGKIGSAAKLAAPQTAPKVAPGNVALQATKPMPVKEMDAIKANMKPTGAEYFIEGYYFDDLLSPAPAPAPAPAPVPKPAPSFSNPAQIWTPERAAATAKLNR